MMPARRRIEGGREMTEGKRDRRDRVGGNFLLQVRLKDYLHLKFSFIAIASVRDAAERETDRQRDSEQRNS